MYMHILGYDVDFGHVEALNLINAPKFSEKCTGYIATGLIMNEKQVNDDHLEMVTNCIRTDLTSGNEVFESLALATIANIGTPELASTLYPYVRKLAFAEDFRQGQIDMRWVVEHVADEEKKKFARDALAISYLKQCASSDSDFYNISSAEIGIAFNSLLSTLVRISK